MNVLDELAAGRCAVPFPGSGHTAARLEWLLDLARTGDVGVARLAEAHVDATAILRDAGSAPKPGCLYGVWASASGSEPHLAAGRLAGTKRFCSGLGIVGRALVTVRAEPEDLLVDVDVAMLSPSPGAWRSPALRSTGTGDADLTGRSFDVVGTAAWYLERPGFWHGACGPAACWAGAAIGLVDAALAAVDDDPHRRAQVGALISARWAMAAMLRQAAAEIDEDPTNRTRAELCARALRHSIERTCSDVADRFSRAFGPRPFVEDGELAQRHLDLHLYLRQHHGERELGAVADLAARRAGEDHDA